MYYSPYFNHLYIHISENNFVWFCLYYFNTAKKIRSCKTGKVLVFTCPLNFNN